MIELRGIAKWFPSPSGEGTVVTALSNVSLEIDRGEFVAIVGPSGSGKSTLLSILGLLDLPSDGQYLFDGVDVSRYSVVEQARFRNAKIGFVFQSFHLLSRTTALENVELPLLYSERESFDGLGRRALEAVGLSDRVNHTPSQLSGGQQQRVAIARALVNEPDLILADEPTGNLDPQSAAEIMNVFRSLNASGRTIVVVTHDPAIARHARRTITLERGHVASDERMLQEVS